MRRRCSIFAGVATVLVSVSLLAQTHPSVPRTIDGQPDLQGVWNFSTITPLERPQAYAGREFMSDAEAKQLEARTAEQSNRDNRSDNRDADVASAYNEF